MISLEDLSKQKELRLVLATIDEEKVRTFLQTLSRIDTGENRLRGRSAESRRIVAPSAIFLPAWR